MNALIVCFHYNGAYKSQRYKLLFDFFLLQAERWADVFDGLYFVASGFDLRAGEEAALRDRFFTVEVVRRGPTPHWANVRHAVELTKADGIDVVGLIDSDTIIYEPRSVKDKLQRIEDNQCDVAAITDGSGGYRIALEFPQFAANRYRNERRRLGPYLLMARRTYLDGLDFSPRSHGSNWTDSFGQATLDVMRRGARLEELEDDRCTLYLEDDNTIKRDAWLDGPPYLWSIPPDKTKQLGYYHIRNFGGAIHVLDIHEFDARAFKREVKVIPRREFLRLMGWCWTLAVLCNPSLVDDVWKVVEHVGVSRETWDAYMNQWFDYHSWLEVF